MRDSVRKQSTGSTRVTGVPEAPAYDVPRDRAPGPSSRRQADIVIRGDARVAVPMQRESSTAGSLAVPSSPTTATRVSSTTKRGQQLEQTETRLQSRLRAATQAIANPANQIPRLQAGQGIVEVTGPSDRRLAYTVVDVKNDSITLRGTRTGDVAKTYTRAQIKQLLLSRDNGLEVRVDQNIISARVPSESEKHLALAMRDWFALNALHLRRELGPKRYRILEELNHRRDELRALQAQVNGELRTWLEQNDGWTSIARIGHVAMNRFKRVDDATNPELFHEAPQREQLRHISTAIAEVTRAMEGVRKGRGIDFEPEYDATTVVLQRVDR
ncbi:MAG: hypothetical protein H7Z43_11530, partial [Clostridia bacterium]|nr:hypothetical protein [Deltaproteobacteria bacterium]